MHRSCAPSWRICRESESRSRWSSLALSGGLSLHADHRIRLAFTKRSHTVPNRVRDGAGCLETPMRLPDDRKNWEQAVAKIKITKTVVDNAEPRDREYELRDTTIPGFLLKVMPTGRKVFMVAYRTNAGVWRKPAIGRFGELTVEQARFLESRDREDRRDRPRRRRPAARKRARLRAGHHRGRAVKAATGRAACHADPRQDVPGARGLTAITYWNRREGLCRQNKRHSSLPTTKNPRRRLRAETCATAPGPQVKSRKSQDTSQGRAPSRHQA